MTTVDSKSHVGYSVSSHWLRVIKFAICIVILGTVILGVATYGSTKMTVVVYEALGITGWLVALMIIFKPLKK